VEVVAARGRTPHRASSRRGRRDRRVRRSSTTPSTSAARYRGGHRSTSSVPSSHLRRGGLPKFQGRGDLDPYARTVRNPHARAGRGDEKWLVEECERDHVGKRRIERKRGEVHPTETTTLSRKASGRISIAPCIRVAIGPRFVFGRRRDGASHSVCERRRRAPPRSNMRELSSRRCRPTLARAPTRRSVVSPMTLCSRTTVPKLESGSAMRVRREKCRRRIGDGRTSSDEVVDRNAARAAERTDGDRRLRSPKSVSPRVRGRSGFRRAYKTLRRAWRRRWREDSSSARSRGRMAKKTIPRTVKVSIQRGYEQPCRKGGLQKRGCEGEWHHRMRK